MLLQLHIFAASVIIQYVHVTYTAHTEIQKTLWPFHTVYNVCCFFITFFKPYKGLEQNDGVYAW